MMTNDDDTFIHGPLNRDIYQQLLWCQNFQTFHNFVYRRRGRPQSSRHFKAMTAAVEQSLTSLPPKFVRDEMGKLAVGPRGRGLQQLALSIGDNSEREADIRSVRRQRRRIGSETAVARWGRWVSWRMTLKNGLWTIVVSSSQWFSPWLL